MENELNKENYSSNHNYLSYSRLRNFMHCESAAFCYEPLPQKESFLIGSYIDAYFSDEFEDFKQNNPEIYNSKTGELKKPFKDASNQIARIEQDSLLMHYLSGEKQKIMVGEIMGVPFKIKMDSYLENEAIVDLKVMKDFKKVYSDSFRSYVNFVEAYDYDIELAIFQEIVRQNTGKTLPCYLVCVTKEEIPDIGLFVLPQEKLDKAMQIVYDILPHYKEVASGEVAPTRCETCDYCKKTKKAIPISYEYAGYTGDQLREEGIESYGEKIKKEI